MNFTRNFLFLSYKSFNVRVLGGLSDRDFWLLSN